MPGTAGDKAEALKAKFPSLADVRVRRNWTEKTATLTLVVRRAVCKCDDGTGLPSRTRAEPLGPGATRPAQRDTTRSSHQEAKRR